jgi:5'-phosphate synthase pdxT subunit
MKIGVLALQGDFAEHRAVLDTLGVEAREVRLPSQLEGLDGLIIPGGESTTIGTRLHDLISLRQFGASHAIWGLAPGDLPVVTLTAATLLGLMDITVERNALAAVESFEADPASPSDPRHVHAIFIRAPRSIHPPDVTVMASLSGPDSASEPRVTGQGRILATAFHPELTGDPRLHRYFLAMADG